MPRDTRPGSRRTALPGANKVWRALPDGRVARDWYAWRGKGAPQIARFEGASRADVIAQENSVEGAKAIAEGYANAAHQSIDTSTLEGILDAWEASAAFRGRAESTKRNERNALKAIRKAAIVKTPAKFLNARAVTAVRRDLRTWLTEIAESKGPRAADTRKDILSKAMNWGIGEGLCEANPAEGIADFSFSDRSDIIWTGADVAAFEKAARAARRKLMKEGAAEPSAPPAIVQALLLACYTGLRREDLVNLSWRDVGEGAVTVRPLKSVRRRKTAGKKAPPVVVIPRTPELDAVLAQAKPVKGVSRPWVLTNSRGKKWTPAGLTSSFIKTRDDANINHDPGDGRDPIPKTLHDARGTFVTHMRSRGYSKEEVADMVGWETEDVDRIAKKYADAERIALAWLERLKRSAG